MKQWRQAAPAKVNLALDILRKRPDGYHDMRMVMQSVSLRDTVTVTETEEGFALRADGFILPAGKKTLEQQTAEAFFAAIGQPMPGLSVTLEKRTPAYAGLGGGSADVAALLRILRDAYCPGLSEEDLERIGLTVGSDMPFCVRGGTALAEGRGELLTDLPPLPDCWLVLCKPDFGIPTPTLFARVDGEGLTCRPDIDGMVSALERGDLEGVAARLGNVFEEVLPEEYYEVFTIKRRLLDLGALNAAMSGSGPTVFSLFREEGTARQAAETLKKTYAQTYLAQPVKKFTRQV
jgi:4-diphosphocytidyl-2-C-methyl-D-erythritol kinase